MTVNDALRSIAGFFVLASVALGYFVHPGFFLFTAFVGANLFLASIATCMGFYALRFCQERGIATEGLGLSLETVRDDAKKRLSTIRVALTLPPGFPEKYTDAIRRAVCLLYTSDAAD